MSVAVVLAYRDTGDEDRRAAHRHVVDRVWSPYTLIEADTSVPLFSRAGAFNAGAEQASADVLVFADADVIPGPGAVDEAVRIATQNDCTVYPYTNYVRLTQDATRALLDGGWAGEFEWTIDNSVGALFVVKRSLYLEAGGCDPRFVGWGFEDVAWAVQSALLFGENQRVQGNLLHLWHAWDPHSWINAKASPVYQANMKLCDRYMLAGSADAVRAIRSEAVLA